MPDFCPIFDADTGKPIGVWAEEPQDILVPEMMVSDLGGHAEPIRNMLAHYPTRVVPNDRTAVGNEVSFVGGGFMMIEPNRAPNEELSLAEPTSRFVLRNHGGVGILWREAVEQAGRVAGNQPAEEDDTTVPSKRSILRILEEMHIRDENVSMDEIRAWGDRESIVPILFEIKEDQSIHPRFQRLANTIADSADTLWGGEPGERELTARQEEQAARERRRAQQADAMRAAEAAEAMEESQRASWWNRLFRR